MLGGLFCETRCCAYYEVYATYSILNSNVEIFIKVRHFAQALKRNNLKVNTLPLMTQASTRACAVPRRRHLHLLRKGARQLLMWKARCWLLDVALVLRGPVHTARNPATEPYMHACMTPMTETTKKWTKR